MMRCLWRQVWDKADTICEYQDYINMRLVAALSPQQRACWLMLLLQRCTTPSQHMLADIPLIHALRQTGKICASACNAAARWNCDGEQAVADNSGVKGRPTGVMAKVSCAIQATFRAGPDVLYGAVRLAWTDW